MGAFTLGPTGVALLNGERDSHTLGQDLTAAHLTQWLRANSLDSQTNTYRATTIANPHPLGTPGHRQPHNPDRRVHHSANLINMPQVGMFRNEDGTLRIPQWNRTLSGTPLVPEVDRYEPEAGLPQILTPWSENETQLMHRLFPKPDSLCLNFGRTGVFQWNQPNSSTMTRTTEWPQEVVGHTLRSCELAGLTHTQMEPQPHMPCVIFRHMGPHFDSYANSGIPDIIGTNLELYCCEHEQRGQLLYLLPHLQLIDVGTDLEHRLGDLQTLTKTILSKTGKRPLSHPDHSTTRRLTTLTVDSLRQEKQQSGFTAECVIYILCNTDLAYRLTDRGYNVPDLDYLGFPYGMSPLGQPMTLNGFLGDVWENLNSSEGWGNWFESITRVCKSWYKVTQRRRSNPSFIAVCDYL